MNVFRKIIEKIYKDKANQVNIIENFINNVTGKYDLVMAFAIIHHMVGQYKSMDAAFDKIDSMATDIIILEIPHGDDVLLCNWKKIHGNELYKLFDSIESTRKYLCERYKLLKEIKIDYNSSDINRTCFVLKK